MLKHSQKATFLTEKKRMLNVFKEKTKHNRVETIEVALVNLEHIYPISDQCSFFIPPQIIREPNQRLLARNGFKAF